MIPREPPHQDIISFDRGDAKRSEKLDRVTVERCREEIKLFGYLARAVSGHDYINLVGFEKPFKLLSEVGQRSMPDERIAKHRPIFILLWRTVSVTFSHLELH